MASRVTELKMLADQRARLMSEMEALRNKIAGLDMAIALLRGDQSEEGVPSPSKRAKRGNVKEAVLDLISESGEAGLSATDCVAAARASRGLDLDRGSVSSLLSRLKKDEVLFYDGERYRLKKYAGPRNAA